MTFKHLLALRGKKAVLAQHASTPNRSFAGIP
jgi:hypothetical protein